VKVRPADLPGDRRAESSGARSAPRHRPADINIAIDSNPGSRFDLVHCL
jgi:hypothetical protein